MSKQVAPFTDINSNDECCVCGAWFPDEGASGWVLCDSNCSNTVCSDCVPRLGLAVSSDQPYYCPICLEDIPKIQVAETMNIQPNGKRRGKKAGGGNKQNRKIDEHHFAAGQSALEMATKKATTSIGARGSRNRPKKSKCNGSMKPIGTKAVQQQPSTNSIDGPGTKTRVKAMAVIAGSRVLETVEASSDMHCCVVSNHRTGKGEDEDEDGAEALELPMRSITALGTSGNTAADLAAATITDTAATASSSKNMTSAGVRGGNRRPKRHAIARRDQRREDRLSREKEQKRREEKERIAREAARRQGFSGNLISSDKDGASLTSTISATSPAPTSTGAVGMHDDKSLAGVADTSNEDVEPEDEDFFEIDCYLDRRSGKRGIEYLVKWKGCHESEATWEPQENLCDSAYEDAKEWWKKELHRRQRIVQSERNLGLLSSRAGDRADDLPHVNSDSIDCAIETNPESIETPEGVHASRSKPVHVAQQPTAPASPTALEDPNWTWDDASQVNFRAVKRISVRDIEAKEQVTEARMNGTPIILTGHVGWAGFASRWLRKSSGLDTDPGADGVSLDLSDTDWYLDVKAMADDIGHEEVPVVKRNYNEEAPISGSITASRFLETSWPSSSGPTPESASDATVSVSVSSALYLHQWQFPLSESAAPKLCNQSVPLPNDIIGEDLLKYWLCRVSDCPLQYIFMGREETMSKLHKDPGGLAISIAPIVGTKECVLVHRDDGQQCLYHLAAPLDPDAIDLDAFPLLSQARIWKTTVSPGEILLMPQGTYHQCRNVTPCLSYSRVHLDTVNLRAFLNSYFDGDAPEMEQDEVLWNCAHSLMEVIDAATDEARENLDAKQGGEDDNDGGPVITEKGNLDSSLTRAVDTLRCLRHVAREFTRKLELWTAVKGKGPAKYYSPETSTSKDDSTPKKWRQLVDDCDVCLHEFRYRYSRNAPGYVPRRSTGKKKFAMPVVAMRASVAMVANRLSPDPGNAGARAGRNATSGTHKQSRPIGDKLYDPNIPGAMQCPKITSRGKRCKNAVTATNSQFCVLHSSLGDQSTSKTTIARAGKPKRARKEGSRNGSASGGARRGCDPDDAPIVVFESEMETAWTCLPRVTPLSKAEKEVLAAQIDQLTPGSRVAVDVMGRKCTAEVLDIREGMWTVFMSYEDYPKLYNEYIPFDRLRIPSTGGGTLTDMNPENIRPGVLAIALVGGKRDVSGKWNMNAKCIGYELFVDAGTPLCSLSYMYFFSPPSCPLHEQEYRGIIQHATCETMYRCKICFGGKAKTERWIAADSILSTSDAGRKKSAGGRSSMLRKSSFLSSEAQWGQRAARQQGAEKMDAGSGANGDTCNGEGEGEATLSDNGRTQARKRRSRDAADAPRSSRPSSSQSSRRKRICHHHHSSSRAIDDVFSEDSEVEDKDDDSDDDDDDSEHLV